MYLINQNLIKPRKTLNILKQFSGILLKKTCGNASNISYNNSTQNSLKKT